MSVTDIIEKIKCRYTNLQRILRLISDDRFTYLYNSASEESKKRILEYIETTNGKAISNWIKEETGYITTIYVREQARKYRIPNYTRQSKGQLIAKLKRHIDI